MSSERLFRLRRLLPALLLVLLAGCAMGGFQGGGGGYGDGAHGGRGYPGDYAAQTLYGTVQRMDPHRNRIVLSRDRRGGHVEVLYDRGTDLYYRGQRLPVEGLEPGDGIRVRATHSGGRWWAQSIEVTYNVREGYGGGYGHPGQLRGEVLYVDPRAQVIGIGRGHAGHERIHYDYRTLVEHRGRRYGPDSLERGDIVRIDLRRRGRGWIAGRIRVERDVSW